jgi:hypothetical protein
VTWSAAQVCGATGASYRQLDYWVRSGYVPGVGNPGSGRSRRLDADQALRVALLTELAAAGVPARRLSDRGVRELTGHGRLTLGTVTITLDLAELARTVTQKLESTCPS